MRFIARFVVVVTVSYFVGYGLGFVIVKNIK